MATLEERIQNLTQDIRPTMGAGVMSDQDVERLMKQPQEFISAPKGQSTKLRMEAMLSLPEGSLSDSDALRMLQMMGGELNTQALPSVYETMKNLVGDLKNQTVGLGVMSDREADMFMQASQSNPMQPLVDLGFGDQVNVILSNPSDSEISRQAQQQIINEMGRGMDIDSFLMEVNNLAPKGAMSDADEEGITQLLKFNAQQQAEESGNPLLKLGAESGRMDDTTLGHLAEGEVVIPAPVLEANPQASDMLEETMMQMGIDPKSRVVDSTGQLGGIASINPETGLQEFGWLSKTWKKVKDKVIKPVAKVAKFVPGPWQAPAALIDTASTVYDVAKGRANPLALLSVAGPLRTGPSIGDSFGAIKEAGKGSFLSGLGESFKAIPGAIGSGIKNLVTSPIDTVSGLFKPQEGLEGGRFGSGITGLFGGGQQPLPEDIQYDPVNQGYINIKTGMPVSSAELSALQGSQSTLGRFEDVAKMLTGDDGMTRTEELLATGMSPEAIEAAKADGTFNSLVAQARAEGKVPGRGAIGAIQSALTGGTQAGGDQDGLGMMGKLGIAGLAGLIGKLAYEEAKDQKGVPLTPLTQMDPLGRYNIEAEIARRTGAEMPSRVEFGLTPEGMPALSGGKPRNARYGGIMAFADGGIVAMAEGGDMDVAINVEEFPVRDGQINGAGTETSDDIPAMLSDGEFVMTAKAVRGAGSFDVNNNNGILTLTPNGEPTRESGTRVMYKLMEHFGNMA
jgi:hypothetical protein